MSFSRYRTVSSCTWADQKVRSLSAAEPSGQFLWFYLLTGPHTTPLPGVFSVGRLAIAELRGWSREPFLERFLECVRELETNGLLRADWDAPLVWLPNALRHNFPANINMVKGWRTFWNEVPECPLKSEIHQSFTEQLEHKPDLLRAFLELSAKPFPEPFRERDANPRTRTRTRKQTPKAPLREMPEPVCVKPVEPPKSPEQPTVSQPRHFVLAPLADPAPAELTLLEARNYRGMPCDYPELALVARKVVEHYQRTVRSAHLPGRAVIEVQALLHAGVKAQDLRAAIDRYGRHCEAQQIAPKHRNGAASFFANDVWRTVTDALAVTPAQTEQSLGLSQLTPIRGPLEGPGLSKRVRKPLDTPEKPHQLPQELRGQPRTGQQSSGSHEAS